MIDSIIKGFEVWTDAQGVKSKGRIRSIDNISLEGILRLRELILELAIRGKLVEQNTCDEPASELIKLIELEKTKLLKDGKIKNDVEFKEVPESNIPFDLPKGWQWSYLDDFSLINGGYAFKSGNYANEGHRVIRISDFDEFGFKNSNIVRHKYSEELAPFLLYENSILLAMTGGTVGKSYLVTNLEEPMVVNQRVATINIIQPFNVAYLDCVIKSKIVQDVVVKAKNSTNDNISMSDIKSFLVPIPPYGEQIRIVEKVKELMTFCDKLEEEQTKNLTTHNTLVKCLLETLTQAKDTDELQSSWVKISQHFETLSCTEGSIELFKKTILELAIMGKLEKQNSKDEPANVLLKKIIESKNRLIEDGLIKRQKELDSIKEEEKPFTLPEGWVFERLNNVIDVRDGTHDSPKDSFGSNTYPLITSKDFKNGKIDFEGARRISEDDHLEISKRSKVEKFDILFSMIGGNIGNQVMVLDEVEFSIKNVALLKYYNNELTFPYFIKKYTEHIAFELQKSAIGGAQPFVSLGFLRNLIIGLPPIEEQKRIVKKVDELFAICDLLKDRISKSEEIKNTLSISIIEVV